MLLDVERREPFFVRRTDAAGVDWMVTNPEVGRNWFDEGFYQAMNPRTQRFRVHKESGTMRIFVLGESAAYGRHLTDNETWARMLECMLSEAARPAEVVNCGISASTVALYPEIVEEIRGYQPDLILVYAGHNEHYGVRDPDWLMGLRLGRLLRRCVLGRERPEEGRTFLDLRTTYAVRPGSNEDRAVTTRFQRDLERVLQAASPTPVLLFALASNEMISPLASYAETEKGVEADEAAEVIASVEAGTAPAGAAGRLDGYLRDLPHHAGLEHALGLLDLQSARAADGLARLQASIDDDAMPLRARTAVNATIRAAARPDAVRVCDPLPLLRKACGGGPLDHLVFLDNVHPTIYGNYLVARAAFEATWPGVPAPGFADVQERLALSPLDEHVTLSYARMFFETSPLRRCDSTDRSLGYLTARMEAILGGLDEHSRQALRDWRPGGTDIHVLLLRRALKAGDRAAALREARRAVMACPDSALAHAAYARLLEDGGRSEEAAAEALAVAFFAASSAGVDAGSGGLVLDAR